ncbi:MAG: metallophosphoesterase family protein [Actinomycetota bacterium]|nr:metallophosphoesterase family protein [Actinomycetota bacterium]MDZ4178058.1 metallophosphoesterase family protein [Coriobacteriia bacterium]
MRRIALFSDIHANLPALQAVLADIESSDVAERYCLGDLVGYGPEPEAVIDLLRETGIPTIQGNYDEGIGNRRGECGCYYATDQARSDGAASYDFTSAAVDDEHAAWLAALPGEVRFDEAGVRILLTHGSPRKINEYLLPDRTEAQLARLAAQAEADVVCVGHIHIPYHRAFSGQPVTDAGSSSTVLPAVHYVSSGSAGKPKDGDPRACWVELVAGDEAAVRAAAPTDAAAGPAGMTDTWIGLIVHRVEYDIEAVASAMLDAGLPPTLAEALRRG